MSKQQPSKKKKKKCKTKRDGATQMAAEIYAMTEPHRPTKLDLEKAIVQWVKDMIAAPKGTEIDQKINEAEVKHARAVRNLRIAKFKDWLREMYGAELEHGWMASVDQMWDEWIEEIATESDYTAEEVGEYLESLTLEQEERFADQMRKLSEEYEEDMGALTADSFFKAVNMAVVEVIVEDMNMKMLQMYMEEQKRLPAPKKKGAKKKTKKTKKNK